MVKEKERLGDRMTKTEELKKLIGIAFCEESDTDYYTPNGRRVGDKFAKSILIACKESGLMFTEESWGKLDDGGWRKRTEITEPIEVE